MPVIKDGRRKTAVPVTDGSRLVLDCFEADVSLMSWPTLSVVATKEWNKTNVSCCLRQRQLHSSRHVLTLTVKQSSLYGFGIANSQVLTVVIFFAMSSDVLSPRVLYIPSCIYHLKLVLLWHVLEFGSLLDREG